MERERGRREGPYSAVMKESRRRGSRMGVREKETKEGHEGEEGWQKVKGSLREKGGGLFS